MPISLVTGGAGFIGSHLVDALLERGQQVRVFDDFSSGTPTNLAPPGNHLEIIRGDTSDPVAVSRATEGVDYVFHLAIPSYASYTPTMPVERWAGTTDTLNVLAAAHQARVKRVIYSSCESVYGPAMVRAFTETDPTLPLSPYALAKLTGEQQCVAFSAIYGLETVRLRYSNVFGPRQLRSGAQPPAIALILKAMLQGQSPRIEGDGQEPHDFIYVGDVAHANILATEARRVSGKVYNVARGRPTTLNEVVETINRALGTELKPTYVRHRPMGQGPRLADIARAEVDLGFCPGTDLEQGLLRSIQYYTTHAAELEPSRPDSPVGQGPHFVAGDTVDPRRSPAASPLAAGATKGPRDGAAAADQDSDGTV
jgi:UDP-glucose 4-epimerase